MHIPFGSKVYLCSLYHVMNHHIHTLFLKIIMVIIFSFGCQIFPLEVLCCVKRDLKMYTEDCPEKPYNNFLLFICNLKPIIFTWTIYNIPTPIPNIQNMITSLIVNVLGSKVGSKVCKGSIRLITSVQNMLMKQIPLS